jgi:thiol-disulfide isomerase/thioredoxin
MKRLLIILALISISSKLTEAQVNTYLRRVDNDEVVNLAELTTFSSDKILGTFVVTWSGEWCFPCMDVLESLGNAAKSGKVKVIAINVDSEEDWLGVKAENYHKERWANVTNLYLDKELNGSFDSYFSVSTAPLTLYFNPEGSIVTMYTSYELRSWMFVEFFGEEMIWQDSAGLNSFAWNYYTENMDNGPINSANDQEMATAIRYIERSIKLDANYNNVDTYAALLYLSGQYTDALKKAKEAIDLAKANSQSYTTTSELIERIIEKM